MPPAHHDPDCSPNVPSTPGFYFLILLKVQAEMQLPNHISLWRTDDFSASKLELFAMGTVSLQLLVEWLCGLIPPSNSSEDSMQFGYSDEWVKREFAIHVVRL